MKHTRRRVAAASTLAITAVVAGAAATSAQAPESLPTLTIALQTGANAPVVDASAVRPGATQIVATSSTKSDRQFVLARLRPGTTAEEIREMTESKRLDERAIDRLGKQLTVFQAQGGATSAAPYRTTVDLEAGTYVAMDISNERRQPQVAFEITGERTTNALPAAAATVDMRDYKWAKSTKTLPAKGTLRIRNKGKQLHFMLAFPASSSKNASRLQTLLRSRDRSAERRAERLIAGPPSEPVGLLSPGVENRVDVDVRPGNYVLVCFYGSPASKNRQHNQLGMARKVRFK